MNTGIITIGNELLTGFIDDTNAAWLGRQLTDIGRQPVWHQTIGDDADGIIQALDSVPDSLSEIIITGGLGPTHDDISMKTVAAYFGHDLKFDENYWVELEDRFARRGFKISENNRSQALMPEGAPVIENPVGSARGAIFSRHNCSFYLLPGVPAEMKAMFTETILPRINMKQGNGYQCILRTTGNIESFLAEKLDDLPQQYPAVTLAYLPRLGGVDLRLISADKTALDMMKDEILIRIGNVFYGYDEIELEEVVGRLLTDSGQTIATAESCTGGLVSHRLTQVAGSSHYLIGGIVAYSNEVKTSSLNVPDDILERHGAVSPETAIAMADGVRRKLGSDIGISTTGIAGPGGGTDEKPVGLVYIGFSSKEKSIAQKFHFIYDRKINKRHSSQVALNIVRLELENA